MKRLLLLLSTFVSLTGYSQAVEVINKIVLKEGEKIKVSKGGFTGAAMWLGWEKDKQPAFYTLSGFGVADLMQQPDNAIALNTGGTSRIGSISLGLLLTHILRQSE